MNPVRLRLPSEATIIFNALYVPPVNAVHLRQDLLSIQLPRGIVLDVGWYPTGDPSGSYVVSVYRHSWDNQLLQPSIETKDFFKVVYEVQRLANDYLVREVNPQNIEEPIKITACSGNTYIGPQKILCGS